MKNVKLILEYDGTAYAGWQKQKSTVKTIQETVEKAIFYSTGEEVSLIGASRTDAGVHAKGFVCNFNTLSTIPGDRFKYAINSKLPEDIVVKESITVDDKFHSRYNAIGKRYVYSINTSSDKPAIGRDYTYHFPTQLDIELMREGAKFAIGKHDFSAFKSSGSSIKDNVRTIHDITIEEVCEEILISFWGDGFLYNMVRNMVGTFLSVGTKKISPQTVLEIIESKDRKTAGKCVPAKGLTLYEVFY